MFFLSSTLEEASNNLQIMHKFLSDSTLCINSSQPIIVKILDTLDLGPIHLAVCFKDKTYQSFGVLLKTLVIEKLLKLDLPNKSDDIDEVIADFEANCVFMNTAAFSWII